MLVFESFLVVMCEVNGAQQSAGSSILRVCGSVQLRLDAHWLQLCVSGTRIYAGVQESAQSLQSKRQLLEKQLEKSGEAEPGSRDVQRASRDVRRSVLRCAELCVCTLSAAGGDLANLMVTQQHRSRGTCTDSELKFDAVIIDEAAQAIEPASLIPLHALNPTKVSLCVRPVLLPILMLRCALQVGLLPA